MIEADASKIRQAPSPEFGVPSHRNPRRQIAFRLAFITGGLSLVLLGGAFAIGPRPDVMARYAPWHWQWWLYPSERNAVLRLPKIHADLNAIQVKSAQEVFAAGNWELVVHTIDSGRTWRRMGDRTPQARVGAPWVAWAGERPVNKDPKMATNPDTNAPYTPNVAVPPNSPAIPEEDQKKRGAQIAPEQRPIRTYPQPAVTTAPDDWVGLDVWGNAVSLYGRNGRVTSTIPGAPVDRIWPLRSYRAPKPGRRWMLRNDGTLEIGGELKRVPRGTRQVFLARTPNAWAVDESGKVHRFQDGDWKEAAQLSKQPMNDLCLHGDSPTASGWAVGDGGRIARTDNGFMYWKPQTSGTQSNLYAVTCLDDKTAWAAGADGTILFTDDGGERWVPQTQGMFGRNLDAPYNCSLPPFAYLIPLLWVIPVIPLLVKSKEPPVVAEESVANLFVSDRPLTEKDRDVMNLRGLAESISFFLRNEATIPPLTVAITGPWGSGKSSLMNLLKADILKAGLKPVWFNAWHHQKEQHILAALLENIRLQSVPPLLSFDGIRFYAKLQISRGGRHLLRLGAWFAVFAFAASYTSAFGASNLWAMLHGTEFDWKKLLESAPVAGTTLGSIYALYKRLAAFGVDPGKLLASNSGNAKPSDLRDQAGFRYQFSLDFKEVTRALGDQTMVIFIDDLDRCRPEQVLEVLEAVNFLVSTGECFVILGMDRPKVEACVGLGFTDIAKEMARGTGNEHKNRADYARAYLDKLVNIEVLVPRPDKEQAQDLLVTSAEPLPHLPGPRLPLRNVMKVLPIAAALLLLVGAFQLGDSLGRDAREHMKKGVAVTPTEKPAVQQATATNVSVATPVVNRDGQTPEVTPAVPGSTGSSATVPLALQAVAILVMIRFLYWRRERSNLVTKDTNEFRLALVSWSGLIHECNSTPRSIKRFLNRVRFLAMRLRAIKQESPISDRSLVGLAAMEQKSPDLSAASGISAHDVSLYRELSGQVIVR